MLKSHISVLNALLVILQVSLEADQSGTTSVIFTAIFFKPSNLSCCKEDSEVWNAY